MNRTMLPVLVTLSILARTAGADDPPGRRPEVWAVAVGVDRYEDGLIPACGGSGRDARAVAEWFERTAGWKRSHVLRMDDLGREQPGAPDDPAAYLRPTRANLDWAVVDWLGRRVKPGDVVVIYFAGQAVAKAPRAGDSSGRAYLLPIDARGGDVRATGWAPEEALDRAKWLAEKQAKVVLWLDTSPLGRGRAGPATERGGPSGRDWLRALTRWPGVSAWLAADGQLGADSGSFVGALQQASGGRERAHNLVGTLRGMLDDPAMKRQGFRTLGGVGPGVSLWSGGALVVEEVAPELVAQAGHGDRVTSVIVTADQARMITASRDSTVRVWSLADRSLTRVLTEPLVGVEALGLDRDGSILVAGDGLGRLIGWDLTADRPRSFAGPTVHAAGIVDLVFLPESQSFVALDRAKRAIVWDAGRGSLRQVRDLSPDPVSRIALAIRPDQAALGLVAATEPVDGEPGRLLGFDGNAQPVGTFTGTGGRISAVDLSSDGRRLVAGDDEGRLIVLDLPGGKVAWRGQFEGPIRLLRWSNAARLLISDARATRLVEPRDGGSSTALAGPDGEPVPGEVERVSFSIDGRWLALCTIIEGRPMLWRLGPSPKVDPVALPGDDVPCLVPTFAADGRTLFVGDAVGGIRSWDLDEPEGRPGAATRPPIPPSRGRVAMLCPSPSGRALLEITRRDDQAMVWDLDEGRGCKPLPGSWVAGAFLADESKLVLVGRPDEGGDVVVFNRSKNEVEPIKFERPSNLAFGSLAVSRSGRFVAAASVPGQRPLACVWRVADGSLVHVTRDHEEGLTAVDISGDEAYWMTASNDGTARVWPMVDPAIELHREVAILRNPQARARAITTARFHPVDPSRVVTGTRAGALILWEWAKGARPRSVALAGSEGEVVASTFSTDGRWLAASWSLGKSIRFWPIRPGEDPKADATIAPSPHHGEQVGALVGWPDGSMIVSGSDDSAVKFWDLGKRSLVGTLMAQARDGRGVDWLAFTPEGLFDGSRPGEAMVKWRVGDRVVNLEQAEDRHHALGLAGTIARRVRPDAPRLVAGPPTLRIESPAGARASKARQVELTVWAGGADPAALRLYQDGVPVRGEGDFGPGAGPNLWKTTVTLRRGDNRFYAMASSPKPGVIDGRSDDLALRFEGPEPAGRVHVLALGISKYERRPLKYAHLDARSISEFLRDRGVRGLGPDVAADEPIVLIDDEVSPKSVDAAFRKLRDAVANRPNDTVILFLAGHTDTDLEANQFCLLLPRFPFEPIPPGPINVAARGGAGVNARGEPGGGGLRAKVNSPNVLPYSVLYNRLSRLDALQRLVIIDACQAGAILEDSAVRNLQRVVDRGSRKARNSYLLAARRGEPASEADALEHGLLTYTLLRGMGAQGLKPVEPPPGPRSADLDGDGFVASDELVAYTDAVLPRLAAMFPGLVSRAGGGGLAKVPAGDEPGPPDLEGRLKIRGDDASFPIVTVPR